ncbi:MAG TPA: LPS biosynthesis glycosyltransferase, partial [Cyanobacteria bacterium UBA11372]|nr:LPS biosynthesis glycosyltransferase [Cyanobacteria bacterium UBA11372]
MFPAIRPDDAGDFPSIGARGCFESHLAILKQALADRLSNVLIVEDDLKISQRFHTEQAVLL